ncbi:MAG: hypothetical protein SX243_08810 [Acidobacteriota bacterium]|nr:hypothetical protein [Acidobacteriota bacterium]
MPDSTPSTPPSPPPSRPGLYRREALEVHNAGLEGRGDPLRLSPRWMRWAYPLLVLSVAAGLVFAALGKVEETAAGVAVVQRAGAGDPRLTCGTTDPVPARWMATVLVPARFLPRLEPGMPLWLDVEGVAETPFSLVIGEVEPRAWWPRQIAAGEAADPGGAEALGGTEAALAKIEAGAGPVAVVRAAICPPPGTRLFDGLPGRGEIVLGSQSILQTLVPALAPVRSEDG